MLVISRKSGQKIMINDNIVITIADVKNGQCRIAIEADKDNSVQLNDKVEQNTTDSEVEINEPQKTKKIVIKKQNPNN